MDSATSMGKLLTQERANRGRSRQMCPSGYSGRLTG
jgi:hypothetical protein